VSAGDCPRGLVRILIRVGSAHCISWANKTPILNIGRDLEGNIETWMPADLVACSDRHYTDETLYQYLQTASAIASWRNDGHALVK
jgi:hypothetical protein